jgi:hypothetical protein
VQKPSLKIDCFPFGLNEGSPQTYYIYVSQFIIDTYLSRLANTASIDRIIHIPSCIDLKDISTWTFSLPHFCFASNRLLPGDQFAFYSKRCFFRRSGTDVMIFWIFSPKKSPKELAFLTQNKAKLWKKWSWHWFLRKTPIFFAENWLKSQKTVIITSTPDFYSCPFQTKSCLVFRLVSLVYFSPQKYTGKS